MRGLALRGAALAALLVALAGCAGPRFAVTPPGEPIPVGEPAARLAAYNARFREVRLSGSLQLPKTWRVAFGARVIRGEGARVDALAGMGRIAFSLACREGASCGLYLPGEGRYLLREGGRLPGFLAEMLAGRVPGGGEAEAAWRSRGGGTLLRLATREGWTEVEFDREEGLPRRVLYGPRGGAADVELLLAEFRPEAEGPFPSRIRLRGAEEGASVEIHVERVLPIPAGEGGRFEPEPPPGVAAERLDDDALWARLGFPARLVSAQ